MAVLHPKQLQWRPEKGFKLPSQVEEWDGTARAEQQGWKTEGGAARVEEQGYEQGLRALPRRAFPDPERETMITHICSDVLPAMACFCAAFAIWQPIFWRSRAPFARKLWWVSPSIF